jgi:apolipoprotein N-acyltransferase
MTTHAAANTTTLLGRYPVITSLLSGVISAFALPFWSVIPLFFIGFSLFIYIATQRYSLVKSFFIGWGYGFGYFTVSLYWIGNAILVEAEDFWWAYPFALFGLPLYLSIYYGLATLISQKLTPANNRARLFALLFTMAIMDFARGLIFTGFPWNSPGLIWIESIEIAQVTSIGGLVFLSAITYFWAAIFYVVFATPYKKFRIIYSYLVIGTIAASYLFGHWTISQSKDTENLAQNDLKGSHEFIIIQPNIPQSEKWDPKFVMRNLKLYFDMSREAILDTPAEVNSITVIWPETALSFNTYYHEEINPQLHSLTFLKGEEVSIILLTGLLDHYVENKEDLFTNSVIGLHGNEEFLHYNKHHLVPFGEYMPYQDYLGWMPLTQIGGFQAGTQPKNMQLPNGINILPLICYEIIFPRHSFAANTTDFIVNLTNDGWYGDSAGPAQHLAITRFRAIEQNRIILRAANTGISAMITAHGHILTSLSYNEKGVARHNFKFSSSKTTIYQKYNYLVFILYLSSILIIMCFFNSKYRKNT